MYNVDKYFDFDSENKSEAKAKKRKKQQQQSILLLLLVAGATYYYFTIYLPDEERKKLEAQIQEKLEEVKKLKKDDYDNIAKLLTTLQGYLLWKDSTETKKLALKNKKEALDSAIKWLQENQETPKKTQNKYFLKGRIWSLPVHNWADRELRKSATYLTKAYGDETGSFPGGEKNDEFYFTRSASWDIYFPPLLRTHHEKGNSVGEHSEMLTENEDLILSNKILAWYNQVKNDPTRGTIEKDNNALFYGKTGTGKSATLKKLCVEVNKCPLVTVKGSSLTPTKQDYDASFGPLQKFIYTISELEWILVKNFCLPRKTNGEVHYILFVDEADQTSNNILLHDPNKLRYLKDCLEGGKTSRKKESQNLWIMATNHLKDIDEAAYRKGRLSNPLDFSWNWNEFKKHFDRARSNPTKYKLPSRFSIPDLPQRWRDDNTLNEKDNKLINKFNIDNFVEDFLGHDPKQPNKQKFWQTFITNNPDAILKTEIMKLDEEGKETNELERIDEREIEIGEFFQFFWQKQESSELDAYKDGKFESPRIPETSEVLADNLPNLGEIVRLSSLSSNALSQSLENVAVEIENISNNLAEYTQNSSIIDDIRELRQQLADLAKEVYKRY